MWRYFCFSMIIFSLLAIRCDKVEPIEEAHLKEYTERFAEAFSPSAEDDIILSTIAYMDNIITQEGNKSIRSIYYNKAELLYKLKRYNEALAVLYQADDEIYDTYKGALLVRLDRKGEAVPLLQNAIHKNKKAVASFFLANDKKKLIIQGLIALYILSDIPLESLFVDLVNDEIVTRKEADIFIYNNSITKEILLNSMWPE